MVCCLMENPLSTAVLTVLYLFHRIYHATAEMETKEIFRDDFTAATFNTSIWSVAEGRAVFRNRFISLSGRNVAIDPKNNWLCLNVTADEKSPSYMQSGMIFTKGKFDFKYGELVIRARVARGRSIWSMVQLISSTCPPQINNCQPEIGAVTVDGAQAKLFHTRAIFKDAVDKTLNYSHAYDSGKQLSLDFHDYKLIWANRHIVWFIDDVNVANYTIFDMDKWPNMQLVISAISDPDDPSSVPSLAAGFCIDSVVIRQFADKLNTPISMSVVSSVLTTSLPSTSMKTTVSGTLPLVAAATLSPTIPLTSVKTGESMPSTETTLSSVIVSSTTTSGNNSAIAPAVSSKAVPAVLGTVIPMVVILCVALSVYWLVRHRKRQLKGSQMRRATQKDFSRSHSGAKLFDRSISPSVAETVTNVPGLENYVNLLEIPLAKLHITDTVLGSGNFGLVRRGVASDLRGQLGSTEVAVKSLKVQNNPEQIKQLGQELKLMAKAGRHLNIVNLLGVVTKGEVLLLLEYAKYGSLIKHLQSHPDSRFYNHIGLHGEILPYNENEADRIARTAFTATGAQEHGSQILSTRTLLNFAFQISRGMEYLFRRSIIHRDLAARNVLICDGYVAKISDFGMARQQAEYVLLDSNAALPIRWMSPEAIIERKFSHKSDVWSFGIVLWEIFSLGAVPYADIDMHKHGYDFVASLKNGFRLEKPTTCPAVIFDLMADCWKPQPDDRMDFGRLVDNLRNIIDKDSDQSYLRLDFGYELFNTEHQNLIDQIGEETK